MKLPANIDHYRTESFKMAIIQHPTIGSFYMDLIAKGWKIFAVRQIRGRCYYGPKFITIPLWAIDKDKPGYWVYYVSHEIAHALDDSGSNHGPEFMRLFKAICPTEFQLYEHEYKPLNASIAGVAQIKPDKESHVEVFDVMKTLGF